MRIALIVAILICVAWAAPASAGVSSIPTPIIYTPKLRVVSFAETGAEAMQKALKCSPLGSIAIAAELRVPNKTTWIVTVLQPIGAKPAPLPTRNEGPLPIRINEPK